MNQGQTAVCRRMTWTVLRWSVAAVILLIAAGWAASAWWQVPLSGEATVIPVTVEQAAIEALPTATPESSKPAGITETLEPATPTPFTPPPTRPPLPTSTPLPRLRVERIAAGREVLFARGQALWRASLDGRVEERLTPDSAFRFLHVAGDRVDYSLISRLPFVSPDGRYLTWPLDFSGGARVLDITTGQSNALPHPSSALADWSLDSRYLAYSYHGYYRQTGDNIYVYDVETGQAEQILALPNDQHRWGILNLIWSPDGRELAFACCFRSGSRDELRGDIRRIDVTSGRIETVGQTMTSPYAWPPAICWTDGNRVIEESDGAVRCSYRPPIQPAVSPDGAYRALLLARPGEGNDQQWYIRLEDRVSAQVLWERPLPTIMNGRGGDAAGGSESPPLISPRMAPLISRVVWSPDSTYLFLDDEWLGTPIWRMAVDGQSEVEMVIEDGYLIDVVPAWGENADLSN